jgi:hypothetical protein
MLRGEPGIYYKDLYPLVCFLPQYASDQPDENDTVFPLWDPSLQGNMHTKKLRRSKSTGDLENSRSDCVFYDTDSEDLYDDVFNPEQVLPQIEPKGVRLRKARNSPKPSIYDYVPPLVLIKPIVALVRFPIQKLRRKLSPDSHRGDTTKLDIFGRRVRPAIIHSNVPFEIALFLSTYLAWLQKQGLVAPSIATGLTNNINTLHDLIANVNRIRNTPIPFAYQAHLRMSMW